MIRRIQIVLMFFAAISAGFLYAQEPKIPETGVVKITAQPQGTRKIGTGFIVQLTRDSVYIVTASHVVEGDQNPTVEFFTQKNRESPARVVGLEGADPKGLGVLMVTGRLPSGLSALSLAPSLELRGGDEVTVIGFPRMAGPWSVIKGNIVSRQGRDIIFSGAIDEGVSGGPLLKGNQVVGLVTGLTAPYGRAAPVSSVQELLRGWGVTPSETTPSVATRDSPRKLTLANTKIGFVSDRDGNPSIYVMDADGTNQKRLTQTKAADVALAWSPDGRKIAFVSNRDGMWKLFDMNADGTNPRALISAAAHVAPSWSPDGTKIAFVSDRGGGTEIYLLDVKTNKARRLIQSKTLKPPFPSSSPSWSPDGTKIAFDSFRDKSSDIYVMNADGTGERRLTTPPMTAYDPAWSPDGTRIAFNTKDALYVMNSDGTHLKRLADKGTPMHPTWSPDGMKIAFRGDSRVDSVPNIDIMVINADGTNLVNLTNHPAADYRPAWSPFLK